MSQSVMDTLFPYPHRHNRHERGVFVQALDNEFFEAYKRLDRLCSDIYGCRNGVSQYIEDMERASYQGAACSSFVGAGIQDAKAPCGGCAIRLAHDSGQIATLRRT